MATRAGGGGQAIPQQAPVKPAPERDSRPNARPERRYVLRLLLQRVLFSYHHSLSVSAPWLRQLCGRWTICPRNQATTTAGLLWSRPGLEITALPAQMREWPIKTMMKTTSAIRMLLPCWCESHIFSVTKSTQVKLMDRAEFMSKSCLCDAFVNIFLNRIYCTTTLTYSLVQKSGWILPPPLSLFFA